MQTQPHVPATSIHNLRDKTLITYFQRWENMIKAGKFDAYFRKKHEQKNFKMDY